MGREVPEFPVQSLVPPPPPTKGIDLGRDFIYTLKVPEVQCCYCNTLVFLLRFQHAMGGVPDWAEAGSKRRTSSDGEC